MVRFRVPAEFNQHVSQLNSINHPLGLTFGDWLLDWLTLRSQSDIALTQFFVKLFDGVSQYPAVTDLLVNFLPGWLRHTEQTAGDTQQCQAHQQTTQQQNVCQPFCPTRGDVCQPLCQTCGDVCQPLCQVITMLMASDFKHPQSCFSCLWQPGFSILNHYNPFIFY